MNIQKGIAYTRVSTEKQNAEGESHLDQEKCCRLEAEKQGYIIVNVFNESYTGTKNDRPIWNEMLNYLKDNKDIKVVFVRDIDRFSRGGVSDYLILKEQLNQYGVELRDVTGVIQGEKNSLAHLGVEYDWSKYRPSEGAEFAKSQEAKNDRVKILTRLIGAEVDLTRQGYWLRNAPYGFKNLKIETNEDKKKPILIPHEEESQILKKIFELRTNKLLSDKDIVKEINKLGYKSRTRKKRDKISKKVIGTTGGNPLSPSRLQEIVVRPVYAGIVCEKWTDYKPVKAKFKGLVSIDTWNKANRGKFKIIELENGEYKIVKDPQKYFAPRVKKSDNPLFPFRKVVLCPICQKPFLGSSSKGRSGQPYPAYHCARNHSRFATSKEELESIIIQFVNNLELNNGYIERFEKAVIKSFNKRIQNHKEKSKLESANVESLKQKQESLLKQIENLSSPLVIKNFESQIEELEYQIQTSSEREKNIEVKEEELKEMLKYARYFMEHLPKLLSDKQKPQVRQEVFRLLFNTLPDYRKLKNGTPDLKLYLHVSSNSISHKSDLVVPSGLEPLLPG